MVIFLYATRQHKKQGRRKYGSDNFWLHVIFLLLVLFIFLSNARTVFFHFLIRLQNNAELMHVSQYISFLET